MPSNPSPAAHQLDLTRHKETADLVSLIRPSAIFHTAAISDPNACEIDPESSRAVNLEAARNLALLSHDLGIPFFFISTDLVFDGEHAPYGESDPPDPISFYGKHKAAAEKAVLSLYPESAVVRIPLLYGIDPIAIRGLILPLLRSLRKGSAVSLFTDEIRTPLSAGTAATGILSILEAGITGTIHLGGPEQLSRYEMGTRIAEIFNLPSGSIHGVKQKDVSMPAPRPRDVSLLSDRARNCIEWDPPSFSKELILLKRDFTEEA